jgi:HAD superfamily hydrolase (TIGR01509 family)
LEEDFQKMLGLKQADILTRLRGTEGGLLPPEAEPELSAEILALIRAEVAPTFGIENFLADLALPFCVASSSDVARIRTSLATAGLLDAFEGRIFSSTMVKNGKPAPDLFLHAASHLAVQPSECLVFEDSVAGITAAAAAGMVPIGYIGGGHLPLGHEALLRQAGAQDVISDWQQAPALIQAMLFRKV